MSRSPVPLLTDFRDWLSSDSSAIAATLERDLDAPIAPCAPWVAADLLAHIGIAQRNVERTVRDRSSVQPPGLPSVPAREALVDWFRVGAARLSATLATADPAAAMWTMWPPGDDRAVYFWHRHIARETAVHRWDAESAFGVARPIPRALAYVSVEELLTGWLPWAAAIGRQACGPWAGETFELVEEGGDGRWTLQFLAPRRVAASIGKGFPNGAPVDVIVRGTASALLLFALNRIRAGTEGTLAIEGDAGLTDRWRQEVRFGRVAGT